MEEGRFSRKQMILWGGILVVLIIVSLLPLLIPHFHGDPYEIPLEVDFTLPRADGGDFQLSDYRSKLVILYFGYTSCPDVCPTTLLDLHRTMEELGDQSQDVTVAFITVDPDNDTPEIVAEYVSYFDQSFIGLVGPRDALQTVYDQFGVRLLAPEMSGQSLSHSDGLYVIDRSGRLRLRIHYGMHPKEIAQDLRRLLRERGV